jgi:hypothetical protein
MRTAFGITLVEMLVALAVTLIMMGAVIAVFGFITERVTDNRAMIETNDRLRSAAHRLREDLGSVTVEPIPWQRPEAGHGYLEVLEGPQRDFRGVANQDLIEGDWDDLLFATVRSKGESYRGKLNTSAIESNTAEVVWYARKGMTYGAVQTYLLCRRQLLVVPQGTLKNVADSRDYYELYDVSARVAGNRRVENTLGDLTKRENRYGHRPDTFPFAVNLDAPRFATPAAVRAPLGGVREGDEVVLTNVLAFDIQVYDPMVDVRMKGDVAVGPEDPGYISAQPSRTPIRGAYTDLGSVSVPGVHFGPTTLDSQRPLLGGRYWTYDTWSFHYEHDGVDQLNDRRIDPGTNGVDDNPKTNPGVDDSSERETWPPYPYPLRGLRVKIRVYEPSSKQVRETTVVESFVPE